jgi:regulator of sigma E protease
MGFLEAMLINLWTVATYLPPFLFVLCIVVFVHELGHFLVGRYYGVKVESFSIGFGPEIVGFTDRYGTRWKFALIPLGGYVKFYGDQNGASQPDFDATNAMDNDQRRYSLFHKPVGQRAAIVAAGPIANFILAIVVFAGLGLWNGRTVHEPYISEVLPNSAAEQAGLKAGDKFLSVGGREVTSFDQVMRVVTSNLEREIAIVVQRGGERVTLSATPRYREIDSIFGKVRQPMIGVRSSSDQSHIRRESMGPVEALGFGVTESWYIVQRTFGFIGGLIVGRESIDQLNGPVGMGHASGKIAQFVGWGGLFSLIAILSVSIGLMNLFPIPMLDGGHLMFYAAEAIRKKPLSERTQEWGFRFGLAFVLMLMVFATFNDIARLVAS